MQGLSMIDKYLFLIIQGMLKHRFKKLEINTIFLTALSFDNGVSRNRV